MTAPHEDILVEVLRRLSALERRMSRLIQIGRVHAVQDRPYRVQVDLSAAMAGMVGRDGTPLLTGWLHVLIPRAGSMIWWSPLSVGEGVLVVSPGGDDVSVVLPALARGQLELAVGDQ